MCPTFRKGILVPDNLLHKRNVVPKDRVASAKHTLNIAEKWPRLSLKR